jgi:hypothetical protein
MTLAFTTVAHAKDSNKWRIHFNGKADKDGSYTITFKKEDGEAETAVIEIKKGTRENEAARETRRKLSRELRGYDVDRDDGEDVKIRARIRADDFTVTIDDSNLKGLSVKAERK